MTSWFSRFSTIWLDLLISFGMGLTLETTGNGIGNDHYNGKCLSSLNASVQFDKFQRCIEINLQWKIGKKERVGLSGFHVTCITGNGRSCYDQKLKGDEMHSLIQISLKRMMLEHYTFRVKCIKSQKTISKAVVVQPQDICKELMINGAYFPYHCLHQLDDVHINKECKNDKIFVSWRSPFVTGNGKYIIQHAATDCQNANCCHSSALNDELHLTHDSTNFSLAKIKDNTKHCIEILMCPHGDENPLNCESKYPPFLVDCTDKTREQMRYVYHWLFGSVALLVITVGVLLMCYRKHRARKRARYDEDLLVEIKEISQNIDNNGKQLTKSESAPNLFIVMCAGCVAVEEFVVSLIHVLRQNGIDAVCEATEEEQAQKYGRGVYLNEKFKVADYVLLFCTKENTSKSMAQHQNLYQYALNAIQNLVIEKGGDLSQYFLAHLDEIELVPETLKTASVDLSRDLHEVLSGMLRRIFGVKTFELDEDSAKRNDFAVANEMRDKVEVLAGYRKKLMSLKHPKCFRETCSKGQRASCTKA